MLLDSIVCILFAKHQLKKKIIGEIPLVETSAVSSDGDICNFNFYYTDCESRLATKEEERLFIRIMSHDRNKRK